jgi:hypothetical protein
MRSSGRLVGHVYRIRKHRLTVDGNGWQSDTAFQRIVPRFPVLHGSSGNDHNINSVIQMDANAEVGTRFWDPGLRVTANTLHIAISIKS